jgi:hypothetical protein
LRIFFLREGQKKKKKKKKKKKSKKKKKVFKKRLQSKEFQLKMSNFSIFQISKKEKNQNEKTKHKTKKKSFFLPFHTNPSILKYYLKIEIFV